MLNHNHSHCQHFEVKFCSICNVAYCTSCGYEWRNYNTSYSPYWIYTTTTDGTSGNVGGTTLTNKQNNSFGGHTHG